MYIRLNGSLPTNNLESPNLSRYGPNTSGFVISGDILGKVQCPVNNSDDYISFLDANNNFVIEIQASQLTDAKISVTDDKGNLLPLTESSQASSGNIAFQLSLKVEQLYDKNFILQ